MGMSAKRKTSISLPLSDSSSSEESKKQTWQNFKSNLKCVSENNILLKHQIFSQKTINEITFSNKDIIWNDKPKSVSSMEYRSCIQIKSCFYIAYQQKEEFECAELTEEEKKLQECEQYDSSPRTLKSLIRNVDRDSKKGETFLSDSNDTLEFVSQFIPSDNNIEYPSYLDCVESRRKISVQQNMLNYEVKSLNSADFIKYAEEEKIDNSLKSSESEKKANIMSQSQEEINFNVNPNNVNNDEDEVDSNVSYYSFHPEVTKWKESNWLLDREYKEINQQSEFEESSTIHEKLIKKPMNFLKNIVSSCSFQRQSQKQLQNEEEEKQENEFSSEESYLSFSSLNCRKNKSLNIIDDSKDGSHNNQSSDSYFYENTKWLNDIQIANYREKQQQIQRENGLLQQVISSDMISFKSNSSDNILFRNISQVGAGTYESSSSDSVQQNINSDAQDLQNQIQALSKSTTNQVFLENTSDADPIVQQQQTVAATTVVSDQDSHPSLIFASLSYETIPIASIQQELLKQIHQASNSKSSNRNSGEIVRNWKDSNYNAKFFSDLAQSKESESLFDINHHQEEINHSQEETKEELDLQSICKICLSNLNDTNIKESPYAFKCQHKFCNHCFSSYILECYRSGKKFYEYKCPQENCQVLADFKDLLHFLSNFQVNTLTKAITQEYLHFNNIYSECPSSTCGSVQKLLISEDKANSDVINNQHNRVQKNVYCPECQTDYCNLCKNESHHPLTCSQFSNLKEMFILDEAWIMKNTKKCPKCFINIEKNEGCMHMTCKLCNFEFCWACLQLYHEIHDCRPQLNLQASNIDQVKELSTKYSSSNEVVTALKNSYKNFQKGCYNLNDPEEYLSQILTIQRAYRISIQAQQLSGNLDLLLYILSGKESEASHIKRKQTIMLTNIQLISQTLERIQETISQQKRVDNNLTILNYQTDFLVTELKKLIMLASYMNSFYINIPQMYVLSSFEHDEVIQLSNETSSSQQ